ncbi:hypothetical protein [Streptomyces sp. NPDC094472]|uniref:hypothetical protein n=1 Tax=Streptomyces sp. NPDC094472 TaxID=3155080 RepID=UPI00331D75DE
MSVSVKFIHAVDPADKGRYEDGEDRQYLYEIQAEGSLAIYEKIGKHLEKGQAPHVVYGPSAWFRVEGDPLGKKDQKPGQVYFA